MLGPESLAIATVLLDLVTGARRVIAVFKVCGAEQRIPDRHQHTEIVPPPQRMAPRKFTPNANAVMQPMESRTHPQALTDKAKRNAHIGVLETFSELSQGHDGDELPRRHTNQLWSCPNFTDTLLFLQKESEMSEPKPVYSPQYRQQLVELVLAGRSAKEVAKEFGLHTTAVAKWVRLDRMEYPVRPNIPAQSRLLGH